MTIAFLENTASSIFILFVKIIFEIPKKLAKYTYAKKKDWIPTKKVDNTALFQNLGTHFICCMHTLDRH